MTSQQNCLNCGSFIQLRSRRMWGTKMAPSVSVALTSGVFATSCSGSYHVTLGQLMDQKKLYTECVPNFPKKNSLNWHNQTNNCRKPTQLTWITIWVFGQLRTWNFHWKYL